MEPQNYRIEVALTKGEIARYNFYHIRWLMLLDAVGFVILMVIVFISLIHPDLGFRNMLKIVIVWGVLILAVGLSQPLILFLQIFILKSPAVENQMRRRVYLFDERGIHVDTGERSVDIPWSHVSAIKDITTVILIYTSPKLAYVIPGKHFLSRRDRVRFKRFVLDRAGNMGNGPPDEKQSLSTK